MQIIAWVHLHQPGNRGGSPSPGGGFRGRGGPPIRDIEGFRTGVTSAPAKKWTGGKGEITPGGVCSSLWTVGKARSPWSALPAPVGGRSTAVFRRSTADRPPLDRGARRLDLTAPPLDRVAQGLDPR